MSIQVIENKHKKLVKPSPKPEILPKHPFRCCFSGCSGSGKTNLLINLIKDKQFYHGYFDIILLFSPTCFIDDSWKSLHDDNILKRENCFDHPDIEILNKIFDKQSQICERDGIDKASRILIILDDIIDNQRFLKSGVMSKMFYRSRHINISIMVSTQSYTKIPRSYRMNFSNLFIFKPKLSELKVITDDVAPSNMTKREFGEVINHCCNYENYSFCHMYFEIPLNLMVRRGLDNLIILDK